MSSFKCGHDAPVYSVIEQILQRVGTPYFCFKDVDENKPSGSINIRVETIDYFLKQYRQGLRVSDDDDSNGVRVTNVSAGTHPPLALVS